MAMHGLLCAEFERAGHEEVSQLESEGECPGVLREIIFLSTLHVSGKTEQREALGQSS